MLRINAALLNILLVALPVIGIGWVLSLFDSFGINIVTQQVVALALGISAAAAFLMNPYKRGLPILDLICAVAVAAAWFWYAYNFASWMITMAFRTPDIWVPGIFAIALMVEALRKSVGLIITILVCVVIAYGFLGNYLPGVLEATVYAPTRTVIYLYADSSGIPGLVVNVIVGLVLPFVVFGKTMQVAGGMQFFNDLALSLLGHRRGGPAKVAVMASASFGSLSGSTVANIMSTGIITIPLMTRLGFRPHQAAAIEAVASNGGQIMPPVMGATAFIIAEFLQVPYGDVVLAAILPALLYYFVLFLKIDSIAIRANIAGLERSELPIVRETLRDGWIFIIPLISLVYFLFSLKLDPGVAAIYATAVLLMAYLIKSRGRIELSRLANIIIESGRDVGPLILIGGGAGAVLGIMNSTGFAFQLSLLLTHAAEAYGLFIMLLLTALVAIVLGMGMPTAAVYIVLVTVVAPTLVNLGVDPMAAHLFLFYFGLMSMITPPIAIGSIVAAQLANANMWSTSFLGVRLGITAYILPFLWIYNPALLFEGSALEIALAVMTCVAAALLLRQSMLPPLKPSFPEWLNSAALSAAALVVGGSTLLFGSDNALTLLPVAAAVGYFIFDRQHRRAAPHMRATVAD